MATLHIRDLKDSVKESLRVRAARNGRSMEAEARIILELSTVQRETPVTKEKEHPYHIIRRAVAKYGPLDIDLPQREPGPEPPDFR